MSQTPQAPAEAQAEQEAAKLDLGELEWRIERQTGFPSELKVAKIILDAGWTYMANPRFKDEKASAVEEIDLIAYKNAPGHYIDPILRDIFTILVVDVKKYSRPVVVFSSKWTDADFNMSYSDLTLYPDQEPGKTTPCVLSGLPESLNLDEAGRSVVVVNNTGDKPKDFDIHQVYSAVNNLYKACHAIHKDLINPETNLPLSRADFARLNVMIPLIVLDGRLLQYSTNRASCRLTEESCILLHSSFIGNVNLLDQSSTYVVTLDYLPAFLGKIGEWAAVIKADEVKHSLKQLTSSKQQGIVRNYPQDCPQK